MLISVVCPHCQTAYQLQDDMRGKAMRCKQTACQKPFLIASAPAPITTAPSPTAPPVRRQTTGSVGDVVPLLPAEANGPAQPPAASWRDAPPARRAEGASAAPPVRQAVTPKPARSPEVPAVEQETDWSNVAPPVRRGKPTPDASFPTAPATVKMQHPIHPEPTAEPVKPRGRLAKYGILSFVALTFVILGAGGVVLYLVFHKTEEGLAKTADDFYRQGTFATAARTYKQLAQRYPGSDSAPFYQFRHELSSLRDRARNLDDVPNLANEITEFMEAHKDDPLLADHAGDLGQSLAQLAEDFAKRSAEDIQDNAPAAIKAVRAAFARARAIEAPDAGFDWAKGEQALAKADADVAAKKYEKDLLAQIDRTAALGTYQALLDIEAVLAREREKYPALAQREEVKAALAKFYRAHLDRTAFVPHKEGEADLPATREEGEPALLLDPLLGGTPGRDRPDTPVALALARGVLYGLDRDSGRARWAMRVGIDTAALPLRFRAEGNRERILALSSDTRTLTALDSDGSTLWRYRMRHACLGQPVVIGNRAYLAARNGDVHEIELIKGKLLGTYPLGQPLTLGGTRAPNSHLIYFPAEAGCVYALDVKARKCESILYSRHPAGSLRGEAALISPEGDDVPGYLVLTQAAGLDAVELRLFPLAPGPDRFAEEPARPRLDGWTWFRPQSDPEKLALLTDAGVLGIFGARTPGQRREQALFGLVPGGGLRLDALLATDRTRARGRAEVVQMEGDDLWVLAATKLHRLRLAWDPDAGPKVIRVWDRAQEVGSPLHGSQSFEDGLGKTALVVVTQPRRQPACWASCIDDETGRLRWRRQLGVVCQAEPLPLAAPGNKPALLLLDQSGALFAVDPQKPNLLKPQGEWVSDPKQSRLADPLDDNPDQPPLVLPVDERSAYVVASPGNGGTLVIRHVVAQADRSLKVTESRVKLDSPLWGTPALVGSRLVVPMANGRVARVTLGENPTAQPGFDWRSARAGPETRGYVLALGGDRFLTSDGIRQLRAWDWPEGTWTVLPPRRGNNPTVGLGDRVVSAPVLLPDGSVVVADSGGVVTLLESQPDGGLTEKRRWEKLGQISAGPFVEKVGGEARVLCVCRSRVVCLDPKMDGVKWQYETPDGAEVVGRPRLAGGTLVVADDAGHYVGVDPATGDKGPAYVLTGSIAPAASPVTLNDDRLLAPLSDGTLLLLAKERLKKQ